MTITGILVTLALLPFFLPERLWPWFIRDPASCTPFEGAAQRWKQGRQEEADQEPDDDGNVVILGAGQVFETPPVPETLLRASDGEFAEQVGAMYEAESIVAPRAKKPASAPPPGVDVEDLARIRRVKGEWEAKVEMYRAAGIDLPLSTEK